MVNGKILTVRIIMEGIKENNLKEYIILYNVDFPRNCIRLVGIRWHKYSSTITSTERKVSIRIGKAWMITK